MSSWKKILLTNFTDVRKLADFLELDISSLWLHPRFILNVPRRLAEKMEKKRLDDPLLRQFIPLAQEKNSSEGFQNDPLEDISFKKEKKLLQKYEGRALVISTSACAMHCRYCFRQNFPYETAQKDFQAEIDFLKNNPTLTEVILSGGDPLSLTDETLGELLQALDAIPHLKRIRFHSRFLIGIPERADASFLRLLSQVQKQIWFVVHTNHPLELDADVLSSLKSIQKLGIPTLNQSVLLKGVNDDPTTLKHLSETLVDNGIVPYYLHQLDRVTGTAHFEVPLEQGRSLVQTLAHTLSGYAVPRYVKEEPGQPCKTTLSTSAL